jgi:hypothetical protein
MLYPGENWAISQVDDREEHQVLLDLRKEIRLEDAELINTDSPSTKTVPPKRILAKQRCKMDRDEEQHLRRAMPSYHHSRKPRSGGGSTE